MIRRFLSILWRRPARIVALSFLLVALTGAGLLMLPAAQTGTEGLTFLDAFFTATSAVCVTGLIVVDTPTAFTLFGQIVILLLIQIGGLGIMAFSLTAIFLTRKRLSIGESELLSYMLNEEDRSSLRVQLLSILVFTIAIETIGVALLLPRMFGEASGIEAVWLAVFHSVSAFCNAGFSLFSDSLVRFVDDPLVNFTVGGLIILGGLGFATMTVLRDDFFAVIDHLRLRTTRERPLIFRAVPALGYPRSESSRIALKGTAILVILGAIFFYLFESGNVMTQFLLPGKYLAALFQSVTLRTAGFNTVDITSLTRATLLITVPFMFIGAASGGTAGGIKIGTIAVVWSDIKRFVLGRRDAELMYRRIPRRTISQAYVLVVTGIFLVFVSLVVLSATETAPVEVVLFEIVSALGTVGLSAGLTGELTASGRALIIALMFLGRLGPLTLFVALQPHPGQGEIRYPDGNPPIG